MDNNPFTILMVDDSKTVRALLHRLLSQIEIPRLLEAADGVEAFDLLNNIHVDLIISDWNMPKVSGAELLTRVRENEKTRGIPFIMLTACQDQETVLQAIRAGATNYLTKPVKPEKLFAKIRQYLPTPVRANLISEREKDHPEGPGDEGLSIFDRKNFMARLMNDEELARDMVSTFLDEIPEQIRSLKNLVENGETASAVVLAHKIKGASAIMGGLALSDTALQLESAGRNNNHNQLKSLVPELEKQLEIFREQIKVYT